MNSEMIGNQQPLGIYFKRVDTIPRHPAQLYEAIAYFIIFLLLL
jgi:prolipoprotein diacylglyceryltransferase